MFRSLRRAPQGFALRTHELLNEGYVSLTMGCTHLTSIGHPERNGELSRTVVSLSNIRRAVELYFCEVAKIKRLSVREKRDLL